MPRCNKCGESYKGEELRLHVSGDPDEEASVLCEDCFTQVNYGGGMPAEKMPAKLKAIEGGKRRGHGVTYNYSGEGFDIQVNLATKDIRLDVTVGPVSFYLELDLDGLKAAINS